MQQTKQNVMFTETAEYNFYFGVVAVCVNLLEIYKGVLICRTFLKLGLLIESSEDMQCYFPTLFIF